MLFPVVLLILFGVIQGALYFHGRNVAMAAAEQGVRAARADGLIAVVRHGKTTRDQLAHALERVDSVGAKTVGVVINLVPSKRGRDRGYGYGYGYGYAYSYAPEQPRTGRFGRLSRSAKAERDERPDGRTDEDRADDRTGNGKRRA